MWSSGGSGRNLENAVAMAAARAAVELPRERDDEVVSAQAKGRIPFGPCRHSAECKAGPGGRGAARQDGRRAPRLRVLVAAYHRQATDELARRLPLLVGPGEPAIEDLV